MIEILETERLLLHPFEEQDLEPFVALGEQESFWWFGKRRAVTCDESAAFLRGVLATYRGPEPSLHAVVERASGELAGYAGLSVPRFLPEVLPSVEVGWRLGESFRGRGYATEAGAAALGWGFGRLGLERILSIAEPENRASARVMDRLGFPPGISTIHPQTGVSLCVRALTGIEGARSLDR